MESPFKSMVKAPEEILKRNKKKRNLFVPFAVTGEQHLEFLRKKEEQKKDDEAKKMERAEERKRKKFQVSSL